MVVKKAANVEAVEIMEVRKGHVTAYILGKSPLILNRMSEKASRELLFPRKKTAADKASNLKHNPLAEYRASMYRTNGDESATRILMPATAFKGALRSVAVDMPGAAKAQIGRLTYVEGDYIEIFGVPKIFLSITRSADMNRTPDVRTRAIIPEWACKITVEYVQPLIREKDVANLLAAAGIMRGVGDWRVEKGSGNYGAFELVSSSNEQFAKIMKGGGRKQQDAALAEPECYDVESADLLTWFTDEVSRRGFKLEVVNA